MDLLTFRMMFKCLTMGFTYATLGHLFCAVKHFREILGDKPMNRTSIFFDVMKFNYRVIVYTKLPYIVPQKAFQDLVPVSCSGLCSSLSISSQLCDHLTIPSDQMFSWADLLAVCKRSSSVMPSHGWWGSFLFTLQCLTQLLHQKKNHPSKLLSVVMLQRALLAYLHYLCPC